jgi:DNA-binding GntR family transcriptional regulator
MPAARLNRLTNAPPARDPGAGSTAGSRDSRAARPPARELPATALRVERAPMHGQILPHLRQDIVCGRWRPGQRLPEPLLCEEFGVSRTPLRDVFRALESEGLLRLIPHVGAVVTEASTPDLLERMELLGALEQFAAAKVASTADADTIAALSELQEAMIAAGQRGDQRDYFSLNDRFHRRLVLGARNAALADAHEHVMWHVHRARHLANEQEPLDAEPRSHHQRIIDSIIAGDAQAAADAIREHLDQVARLITRKP